MAVFQVTLEDGVSGPAAKASESVGKLADGMAKTGPAAGAAADATGKAAGQMQASASASKEAAAQGQAVLGAMSKLPGPLGEAAQGAKNFLDNVQQIAQSMGPVAAAVYVAIVAITALGKAVYEFMSFAVQATQEKDALRETFNALGEGADAGQKTLDMLEEMSTKLPFTTDQLAKWGKGLMAAGLHGEALEHAIKAVASAQAIMGESGAAAAQNLIQKFEEAAATGAKVTINPGLLKKLASAGVSASALAAELGVAPEKLNKMSLDATKLGDAMKDALIKKGKGALEGLGLTWDSIKAKFMEGFGDAFEDLGEVVKPFMQALKSLFGEFNKGSHAAGDFKSGVVGALTVMFTAATKVVNFIHLGFLKLYAVFLRVKIAVAPIASALGKLVPAGTAAWILANIFKAVVVVAGILGAAIAVVVATLALLAAGVGLVWAALGAIIGVVIEAVSALGDLASGAWDAAGAFISGLVGGIQSGVGAVVDAVKGLASSAVGALKGALGIHSPSAVGIGISTNLTDSVANTMNDNAGDVHAAAKGVGQAAVDGLSGASGASGKAGASGRDGAGAKGGITIDTINLTINAAGGDALKIAEEEIALMFERIALREQAA